MDFTIDTFLVVVSWFLTIIAAVLIFIWGFYRHTWSIINVVLDHYILKRTPEMTITRGLKLQGNTLYNHKGWFVYLRDRISLLEKSGERKLERSILKDIVDSMSEFTPVYTGKRKNKIRGKGYKALNDGSRKKFKA